MIVFHNLRPCQVVVGFFIDKFDVVFSCLSNHLNQTLRSTLPFEKASMIFQSFSNPVFSFRCPINYQNDKIRNGKNPNVLSSGLFIPSQNNYLHKNCTTSGDADIFLASRELFGFIIPIKRPRNTENKRNDIRGKIIIMKLRPRQH